ncbi:hypothetical protein GGP41_000045 [Bipolaris sorokiniana]|uniref:Uncharacterized protein n=1 Tax=Cochliobolus sativus TaxID=45130 RepID=A0A8H5ZDL0_COCSA|nr:hypothetical protein GGP41_000045 [Bipolaris sorokiniana]
MALSVALRTRWRRALTSLTSLALAGLYNYPFCLCSSLAAGLVALRDSVLTAEATLLYVVFLSTLLPTSTLLSIVETLDSLATSVVNLRDSAPTA